MALGYNEYQGQQEKLEPKRADARVDLMAITDYKAKYLAFELIRQVPSDSMDKLAAAVASAQVERSPLDCSTGLIMSGCQHAITNFR